MKDSRFKGGIIISLSRSRSENSYAFKKIKKQLYKDCSKNVNCSGIIVSLFIMTSSSIYCFFFFFNLGQCYKVDHVLL